jgi:hypothetical protein
MPILRNQRPDGAGAAVLDRTRLPTDSSIGVPPADAQGASRRPSSAGRLTAPGFLARAVESERGFNFVLALFT